MIHFTPETPSETNRQPPGGHDRLAEVHDRFSTALLASAGVEDFCQRLLEILVNLGSMDVAVARLREGDRLRSRASIGLDDEVLAGFALTLDLGVPLASSAEPASPLSAVAVGGSASSEFLQKKGLRALHCLTLRHGDHLIGTVHLGLREERQLAPGIAELYEMLAPRAAAALERLATWESLREDIRARDSVLGVVAHDLRNPLNVISLTAQALMQRLADSSARRSVERILRGAQRADRLVQDLLEISAIEGRQFSIARHAVETASAVLAALESQQSLAANASIILATDISPELPLLEADEERLLEVIENLVGNAIKFTGRGGTITVGAAARDPEILFWVKDTGCGIPQEQLPHLFNRFWQANKQDRRGSGLGLTICKAIVEAHGGRIWAETQVGVGTTMFFTIPATAAAPNVEVPEAVNLLLVDDRPENLLALKAILDRPDYRLVTATSGDEALRLVLRQPFAVALVDIAMPGMSGLEVAVHLKELDRSRHIPIIFITAFGDDPKEIHRAYSAGGADYIVKPLDAEIVRKKVAVFVDLSRRRPIPAVGEAPPISSR